MGSGSSAQSSAASPGQPTVVYTNAQYVPPPQAHRPHVTQGMGYPAPSPPTSKKADVFRLEDYAAVDRQALKAPLDLLYESYEALARYITQNLASDLQKVRALFRWVTAINMAELEHNLPKLPDSNTPCDYLLKIHWRIGNHAYFFAHLSRAIGIPCVIVRGINKSAAYEVGEPLVRAQLRAQWNAVYVDGEWRLLDVFWASTVLVGKKSKNWALIDDEGQEVSSGDDEGQTAHVINEFFFLTNPDQLIATHFPDDDCWQLLNQPISEERFEESVYSRERFYQLNLNMLQESCTKCRLKTKNGQIVIKLGIDPKQAHFTHFRYLLFRSRKPNEKPNATPYERFVFYEKKENCILYTINFPVEGVFKLNIFGQHTKQHESMDLVCAYVVDCNDPKSTEPLPACPEIGWGPGLEAKDKGLTPTTHQDAIIQTDNGNVEIRFHMDQALNVMQTLRSNKLDDWLLSKFAIVQIEGNELVLKLRLPGSGEFALEMFGDTNNTQGILPNICNYLIKCKNNNINPTPFPRLHEGTLGRSDGAETLRIWPTNHPSDTINTDNEHLNVGFRSDDKDIEILCELHNNNINGNDLANCCLKSVNEDQTSFDIGLPQAGEYALNVYARKKGEDQIHHIHTYMVVSTQDSKYDTNKPGIVEDPVVPMLTHDGEVNITLPKHNGQIVTELTQKNAQGNSQRLKAKTTSKEDENSIQLNLPEQGQYTLDLFNNTNEGTLSHLKTYQIVRDDMAKKKDKKKKAKKADDHQHESEEALLEAKHKVQREKLRNAVKSDDPQLIQQAIKVFEESGTPDAKGELEKAKEYATYLTLSAELKSAMAERKLDRLEKAVAAVDKAGLRKRLEMQVAMAQRIIDHLKKMEKLRHEIMKLDQRAIAELKSYDTPPEIAYRVMMASYLLMGEQERLLKEWRAVVVLLGKTGKESLKRRVSEFVVEKLKIDVAMRAKAILSKYELSEVAVVSNAVASFFIWSKGMIEECESRYTQKGGDLKEFQQKAGKG